MNVVTNTAVSVIFSFPPSLTKCSAQPIGMNTSSTLLRISIPFYHALYCTVLDDLHPRAQYGSSKTGQKRRRLANLALGRKKPRRHAPQDPFDRLALRPPPVIAWIKDGIVVYRLRVWVGRRSVWTSAGGGVGGGVGVGGVGADAGGRGGEG